MSSAYITIKSKTQVTYAKANNEIREKRKITILILVIQILNTP